MRKNFVRSLLAAVAVIGLWSPGMAAASYQRIRRNPKRQRPTS